MKKIPCIRDNRRLLSPIVGYIYHEDRRLRRPIDSIAVMRRLGKDFVLTVENDAGRYVPDVPAGTYLGVGERIGHIESGEGQNSPVDCREVGDETASHADAGALWVRSPVSGFLVYTNAKGDPYCQQGDVIHPGMCVAAVEFMKLRVEILYDAAQPGVFLGYAQPSSSRVEADGIVAKIAPMGSEGSGHL